MLLALPPELLAAILACLGPHALLAAAAASRLLARIVAASSRLQYTLALAKHRLLDIHPAAQHPPYAARLRLLTDRESAWSALRWKARHTLKLPPTGSVYEFVGGIYGNGREDDNRITASISFLELPTASSDPSRPLRTWTHPMGDVTIIDFTMDPSQDLLVLVAVAPLDSKYIYNLHLRTISTNEPHPRAPLPILHCLDRHPSNPPHHELFAAVRVQVSGHLVGLLIKEAPDPIGAHLQIWNWENDPYYPCTMSSQHGIDDFTFLSRSAFLTVLPVGQFVVYSFPDPLVSPAPPSKASCEPTKKYMYEFPELTNGYMYWYISMSCNPAPGYVPCQGGRAMNPFPDSASTPTPDSSNLNRHLHASTKQLYYPLPDERIHACCIYIFNPNHQPTNLTGNNNNGNPTNPNHATSTAAATGGPTQNGPMNPNFLTDDELDEENQQVHSFVFFMNLKNLLDPPDEWFHWQDKKKTTPATTKIDDSLCISGMGHSDNTAGISLESSLNALKRRQEENELHDAKAGGNGHEKGKKKMKTGNSSSSLSVEVPIDGSLTQSNGIVMRSKSLVSSSSNSMIATTTTGHTRASSSTSQAYPPFPTFSSPLSTTGSPSFGAGNISRASSLDEVEDIIMATSDSLLSSIPSSTKPPNGRNISSCSNTTFTPYSNAIASTPSNLSPSSPNKTRSTSTPPTYTPHNYNHSNASCSTWRNNTHHHQDVKFPGGFAPSTSTSSSSSSSSSMQTLPFPHSSSSSFSANQEQSQNTTNRQQKQESNNSTPSASPPSSSSADTLKKLQETPVPWEVWGPSSTRWFEECLSTDWQHAIYGLRTVESVSVRERERMLRMRLGEKRRRDAHSAASTAYQEAARQKEQKERGIDNTKGNKGKGKAQERRDLSSDDDNEQGVPGKDKGKDLIKGGILGENDDEIFQQDLVDQGRSDDRPKLKGDKNPDFIHVAAPNNAITGPSITTTTTYPTLSHSSQSINNGTGTTNGVQTTMASIASSSSSSNGLPVRRRPRRFLRVRDFNPYSLRQAEAEAETGRTKMRTGNGDWRMMGKGKQREIYSSFSPLPISPTTTADMMPLPSTSAYSYPYPIHLNVNSNFLNYSALSSTPLARSSANSLAIANSSSATSLNGATDLVQWGKRRVVREPSVTPVRGVFKRDVVSWLPYTEVVSEETFEVTDVMMDDCRLLLLKARAFLFGDGTRFTSFHLVDQIVLLGKSDGPCPPWTMGFTCGGSEESTPEVRNADNVFGYFQSTVFIFNDSRSWRK